MPRDNIVFLRQSATGNAGTAWASCTAACSYSQQTLCIYHFARLPPLQDVESVTRPGRSQAADHQAAAVSAGAREFNFGAVPRRTPAEQLRPAASGALTETATNTGEGSDLGVESQVMLALLLSVCRLFVLIVEPGHECNTVLPTLNGHNVSFAWP